MNVSIKNIGVGFKTRGCQFSDDKTPPPPHPFHTHKNNYKRMSNNNLPIISIILKQKRLNKELTQRQLADKAKVSEKTIKNWEQGVKNPALARIDTIKQVCDILDIDINLIFYKEEESNNE